VKRAWKAFTSRCNSNSDTDCQLPGERWNQTEARWNCCNQPGFVNYPHPACYKTSFRPGRFTTQLPVNRPQSLLPIMHGHESRLSAAAGTRGRLAIHERLVVI
jgi:hypothetical protein